MPYKRLTLKARPRGFHLVTAELLAQLPELKELQVGMLHLTLQHTSASLTLNENTDPDVRFDFETLINRLVPEGLKEYRHVLEGADDLPAHMKSSLLGVSVAVPVIDGALALGMWQGVYLGEHRNHGGSRQVVAVWSAC